MANLLINSLGNRLETSLATLAACGPMATISQTVREKPKRNPQVAIIYYNVVNHIQMVSFPPRSVYSLLLLALLLAHAHTQDNSTVLELNSVTQVTLQPNFIYSYSLTLDSLPNNTDLYFLVQSPPNDPLQTPFLDIASEDGFVQRCYSSADEFNGVCSIPKTALRNNLTLKAEIYCYVQCHLTLNPHLSSRLRLALDDSPTFTAPSNNALPVELELQVPTGLLFTQIAIYARIVNFKSATSGIEFVANTGNYDTSIPTKDSYDVYGESIYWGGRGLFFSKEEVAAGEWIKLFLLLGPGMQVTLTTTIMNGNDFNIELGKAYFDFTSALQGKNYVLNTTTAKARYANKTIGIGFIIYAGDPTIEVSFDPNFTHVLSGRSTLGTISYLLTALTRSTLNFSDVVYIRVRSGWNSDYYLYSEIDESSFISVFPDVSYYSYIAPSEVYNYFFDDIIYTDDNQTLRTYSLKIDMFAGSATFGVRRCRDYESGSSFTNCLLVNTSSFQNMTILNTFYEIPTTLKRTETYVNLIFEYDLSKCEPIGNLSAPIAHYCSFHIVAGGLGNTSCEFTMSVSKRRFASLLREGQVSKDLLFKDEYLYYKLGLSSLADIVSITVFVTVIEGDVYLLSSSQEEFPDFDTNQTKLKFSTSNSITYSKSELTNNMYFSVYGIEFSEFTIAVSITRQEAAANTTNSTAPPAEKTKTALQMALSQEFTLVEGETTSSFLITTAKPTNITIQLIQLAGKVNMKVIGADSKAVSCRDESVTNSKISCSLTTQANQQYQLVVSGAADQLQQFIILYYKETHCTPYSLNMPLYVEVEGAESGCATFTLSKLTTLQVTSSLPLLHVLQQSLSFRICVQDTCFDSSSAHHRTISKSELSNSCQLGNNKPEQRACNIRVEWSAAVNASAVSFSLIVEQQGRDMGLFDGISAKVSSYDLSHSVGKYFYYPIYSTNTLKLFFTAFTSNSFYLAAHFIEESQFIQNSTFIYLPYRQTSYDLARSFSSNLYEAIIYGSNTNVFTIPSKVITKYCKNCLLTISVYPIDTNAHSLSFFELEATQAETILHPGDTKAGYLEQDEIYNYQLSAAGADALLYIRDLSKESNNQKECFSARVATVRDDSTTDVTGGFIFLKKDSPLTNLYVEALEEICSYEVSYTLVETPLFTLTPNRQFTIELRNRTTNYFLYTHTTNASFRIIEQVESGSSLIFATPVANNSIQNLLRADPFTFPFVNIQKDGEFVIGNTSAQFTGAGTYLIAVRGDPAVNSQLLVTDLTSSIALSLNGILKEKLKKGSTRTYTFYSISAFNLTVNLDYGQLRVSIRDPTDSLVHNSTLSDSKTIAVPHNKQTEEFSFDFSSIYTRFTIEIEALRDSSYSLKASKLNITSRIFEGIPAYLTLPKDTPVLLEFLNLKSPLLNNGNTLNLLIDAIDIFGEETQFALTATASIEAEEGGPPQLMQVNSLTRSDNTFNLEIPLRVGSYYLSLTANSDALVTAILVKEALIHLQPSANAIMLREGVFQLFSDQKSAMIEVFTCWGDLSLAATDNYLDFAKREIPSGEVVLEQNNYGGHFVVSAESIFGEYFVRVASRTAQSEVAYLINYYFYDSNDLLPYKLIDLPSREINYALIPQALSFTLRPLIVKWALTDSIKEVDVVYRLYVADNRNKVTQFANCRLGKVYTLSAADTDVTPQTVTFRLDNDALQQAVADSETYFVSAEAIVNIIPAALADEDYPETLRLIYDTVQLANIRPPASSTPSAYSTRLIIIWILLPFAIAGLLLYFALKYCINKYRGLLPNELMQEAGESEQHVVEDKGSNASQSLKDEV